MSEVVQEMILPSSPADLAKIKAAIVECDGAMIRMESEREFIKEAVAAVSEEYNVDKKIIRKLLRVYHKANRDQVIAEADQLDVAYAAVFERTPVAGGQ